ncbi:hypothetical protein D9M69_608960 [compost metagenome]
MLDTRRSPECHDIQLGCRGHQQSGLKVIQDGVADHSAWNGGMGDAFWQRFEGVVARVHGEQRDIDIPSIQGLQDG